MKTKLTLLIFFLFAGLTVFAQCQVPYAPLKINGKLVCFDETLPIELFAGDTLDLTFSFTGFNQDSLSFTSDFGNVFPGSTFNVITPVSNQHYHKIVKVQWITSPLNASLMPVLGRIRISDNATPITGITNLAIKIRVNKTGSITCDGKAVNITDELNLQPGMPFNFRLSSVDTATSDSIRITSNVQSILPATTFSTNTALQQTADITWTPTAADVSANPYIFTLTLQDNSIPGGRQYTYTVRLRVSNALAVRKELNLATFTAFPNPFSDELRFSMELKTKAERIVIYNLLGQQVDQISLKNHESGKQVISWEKAAQFPKGTYFARLFSDGNTVQVLKFTKQ